MVAFDVTVDFRRKTLNFLRAKRSGYGRASLQNKFPAMIQWNVGTTINNMVFFLLTLLAF
jgi:hypothetical protein